MDLDRHHLWPLYIIGFTDGALLTIWIVMIVPLSIYMLRRPNRRIDIYEHAIAVHNTFKTRICAYKQVRELIWDMKRVVYHGTGAAYSLQGDAFTRYKIKLFVEGQAPLKIVFKTANPEAFLSQLKEQVLAHALVHYKQSLGQKGKIAWGRFAHFTPNGLACSKSLLRLFRIKTSLLPLDNPLKVEVCEERIFLSHADSYDAKFVVRYDEFNFLPGYELLREKLSPFGQQLPPLP